MLSPLIRNQSECPYVVLATYKPPKYRGSVIGKALTEITKSYGLIPLKDPVHGPQVTSIWCDEALHAEVRRFAQPKGQGHSWHKDGDLAPGSHMDHALVVWAAVVPTEFNFNGKIYQPEPFEVVIGQNLACSHRTPPNTPNPPTRRWFFRQRVEIPHNLELP